MPHTVPHRFDQCPIGKLGECLIIELDDLRPLDGRLEQHEQRAEIVARRVSRWDQPLGDVGDRPADLLNRSRRRFEWGKRPLLQPSGLAPSRLGASERDQPR